MSVGFLRRTKRKLDFLKEEFQTLKDSGLYGIIRTIQSAQGAWLVVDGVEVLNLCSNNYLGLANQPKLKEAVKLLESSDEL